MAERGVYRNVAARTRILNLLEEIMGRDSVRDEPWKAQSESCRPCIVEARCLGISVDLGSLFTKLVARAMSGLYYASTKVTLAS